jgi:hypothetical protein
MCRQDLTVAEAIKRGGQGIKKVDCVCKTHFLLGQDVGDGHTEGQRGVEKGGQGLVGSVHREVVKLWEGKVKQAT